MNCNKNAKTQLGWRGLCLALPLVAAQLVGCGGAGTSPAESAGTPGTVGPFSIARLGATQELPAISTSKSATAYGLGGASFTTVYEHTTAVAPDAPAAVNRLVVNRDGELVLMDGDGKNVQYLTSTSAHEEYPKFSFDGTKIVFESYYSGSDKIEVINADGTGRRVLFTGGYSPTFSRDNSKVIFSKNESVTRREQLFSINLQGGDLTQLTSSPDLDLRGAEVSPDGTKILADGNDGYMYTVSISGGTPTRVSDVTGSQASWSPDGSKIVFLQWGYSLATMNANGTSVTRIDIGSLSPREPRYTRDGSKVIFTAGGDLYVINAVGGVPVNITSDSTRSEYEFDISPVTVSVPPPTSTGQLTRYIGNQGKFGASSAGFLFSQIERNVISFASFDTKVTSVEARSKTRVEALTSLESQSQSLIFAVTTTDDSQLGPIRYATAGGAVQTPFGSNYVGYIVSFSALDGGIATIIPINATKNVNGKPFTWREEGGEIVLQGQFPTVWDAKNESEKSGATSIRLNAETGKVVSQG